MYASIVFLPLIGALIAGWLSLSHRDRAAELSSTFRSTLGDATSPAG